MRFTIGLFDALGLLTAGRRDGSADVDADGPAPQDVPVLLTFLFRSILILIVGCGKKSRFGNELLRTGFRLKIEVSAISSLRLKFKTWRNGTKENGDIDSICQMWNSNTIENAFR